MKRESPTSKRSESGRSSIKYIGRIEYKEYKVTIDNEVSFKEFNERYEIINQEGEIYTIIEKNNE